MGDSVNKRGRKPWKLPPPPTFEERVIELLTEILRSIRARRLRAMEKVK